MAQKKRKLSYWERRNIDAEQKINDGAIKVEEAVANAYRQAQTYLTQKVRKLFVRSQQRFGLLKMIYYKKLRGKRKLVLFLFRKQVTYVESVGFKVG